MKTNLTDIRLAPLDDLFETVESWEDNQWERIYEIELSKIRSFPDHPYHVKDDDAMNELVDSIKTNGLLSPILVRKIDNDHYCSVSIKTLLLDISV